jgi:glycosyltransferase involved in cell wall biosynthesis
MKALIIAPQPFFSPRGTPFSVYYRTLVTSELGVKIDLLTYGEGQDVDIPDVRIIRIPHFKILGPIKIGPSYLKLFLDIFVIIWTVGLLLKNHYDFVHAHEEAIFFCHFLKPIFRFKLIYDMHSSLPQQLTNFQFTDSKFIIRLFKNLEEFCLRSADAVITICPDLENYVDGLIQNRKKHLLIENSIFEPVKLLSNANIRNSEERCDSNQVEREIQLPQGKRFVVYAGTLESYQGIDILIKAFKRVVSEIQDAYLIIVGGAKVQVKFYYGLAETLGIKDNILFTGRVPQILAKNYCKRASVLVSPRSEGTNTPLKIYEQLASGIPLVATKIYSHTQVLNNEVAFLVKPEPDDMASGIIKALDNSDDNFHITANAKKLYKRKYSRTIYTTKMRRVIEILKAPNDVPVTGCFSVQNKSSIG